MKQSNDSIYVEADERFCQITNDTDDRSLMKTDKLSERKNNNEYINKYTNLIWFCN